MPEVKTSRPFQQRFLDGYDRSELRQEVQKVKPRRFKGLRKKYATLALGASLAFGGLGVPMKMMRDASHGTAGTTAAAAATATPQDIQGDLDAAKNIASQVAGGVQAIAGGVTAAADGLGAAAKAPLQTVAEAPKTLTAITENVKEAFFKKEVPFGSIIYNEAKKNNISPELVAAVVHTESKFKPTARSQAGAVGLMQLVPRTGRWLGARDLTNPAQNIQAGAKYLRYLTDRFNGDEQKAIAAYNAGEGNVRRFGGVPPFKETRNYIKRVKSFQDDLGDRLESHSAATQMAAVQ
jgi:soluble lytic murein transglycosylase-like protein